jgi:hypothetical protein
MIRIRFTLALLATLLLASVMVAQIAPDDLILTGVGFGGGWDTEIELADSQLGVGTAGEVTVVNALTGPCPPFCDSVSYTVPPHGTTRIRMSEAFPAYPGLRTVHVSTITEQPLPVVRARIFNGSRPAQSAEVPVFRNPTLAPRSYSVLVFPGLQHANGDYSNLVLQNLDPNLTADVLVEAFDAEGRALGSEIVGVPRETFGPLVLVDVAGALGAAGVDGGSLRVTRRSGSQPLWGVLATVYADGRVAVVSGANP